MSHTQRFLEMAVLSNRSRADVRYLAEDKFNMQYQGKQ